MFIFNYYCVVAAAAVAATAAAAAATEPGQGDLLLQIRHQSVVLPGSLQLKKWLLNLN